jgi:hypothetical protein
MRPRNLLKIFNHCRGFATNFNRQKIEDADIEKGLKDILGPTSPRRPRTPLDIEHGGARRGGYCERAQPASRNARGQLVPLLHIIADVERRLEPGGLTVTRPSRRAAASTACKSGQLKCTILPAWPVVHKSQFSESAPEAQNAGMLLSP